MTWDQWDDQAEAEWQSACLEHKDLSYDLRRETHYGNAGQVQALEAQLSDLEDWMREEHPQRYAHFRGKAFA